MLFAAFERWGWGGVRQTEVYTNFTAQAVEKKMSKLYINAFPLCRDIEAEAKVLALSTDGSCIAFYISELKELTLWLKGCPLPFKQIYSGVILLACSVLIAKYIFFTVLTFL